MLELILGLDSDQPDLRVAKGLAEVNLAAPFSALECCRSEA